MAPSGTPTAAAARLVTPKSRWASFDDAPPATPSCRRPERSLEAPRHFQARPRRSCSRARRPASSRRSRPSRRAFRVVLRARFRR